MKRIFGLSLLLIVVLLPARAQDSGLSFLALGVDAEGLARGDAGVARAEGAFSTYWNPAGLAHGTTEIGIAHHLWIGDIRTYALNAAFALGEKTGAGIAVVATGAGDLEARQEPGASDGLFDAQFVSASASLGRQFGPLRTGFSVRFLSERIFTNSASGYGFDIGVQTDLLNESLHVGAVMANIGNMEELNVEATELPRLLRVGVEVFPFRAVTALDGELFLSTSLLAEVSRNYVTDRTQWHFGLSAEVLETVTARVGYLSNDFLRDISAGVGIEVADLWFDYAVLPFEDGFGGPAHILSLRYGL